MRQGDLTNTPAGSSPQPSQRVPEPESSEEDDEEEIDPEMWCKAGECSHALAYGLHSAAAWMRSIPCLWVSVWMRLPDLRKLEPEVS